MLSLITLPDGATMINDISEYSSPLFDDLLPIAMLAIGFIVGIFILGMTIELIKDALHGNKNNKL